MNALRDALVFEPEIIRPTDRGLWGSEVEPTHLIRLSGALLRTKQTLYLSPERERVVITGRVLLSIWQATLNKMCFFEII